MDQPEASSATLDEQQKLLLDGLRRLEGNSPIFQLPRLVMTQHLAQMLGSARQRTADSHAWEMGLLGAPAGHSDGGGISVQGDTMNFNLNEAARRIPWAKLAGTAAMVILPLWAGAGGAALWNAWKTAAATASAQAPVRLPPTTQPAPPAATPESWRLGIQLDD